MKGCLKEKFCFVSKDQKESSFRQSFKDIRFSSKNFEKSLYCRSVQKYNSQTKYIIVALQKSWNVFIIIFKVLTILTIIREFWINSKNKESVIFDNIVKHLIMETSFVSKGIKTVDQTPIIVETSLIMPFKNQ